MDNLNTHGPGSLYDTFEPGTAKVLWDRFEFVYTPKHGSWLNMAEVELNVLIRNAWTRESVSSGKCGTRLRLGKSGETTRTRKSTGSSWPRMPAPN